ncbi:MAG: DNA-binding domain-containing protein [Hyphomicrobium sp.]|jgi:hypothetical protein
MKQAPKSDSAKAPTLRDIQSLLQEAILTGDDAILGDLMDGPLATRDTLFGVYRNAYASRLIDILMGDYPFLRGYVGDAHFRKLASAFIAAHPSHSQNARWFGTALPDFLQQQEEAAKYPELFEIAVIERAVANAFDSQDAPVLGFAGLAAYPPEDWSQLTFAPQPSVTLLQCATNAFDIWKALKDDAPPPAVRHPPDQQHVVVWRQATSPKVRVMSAEEAMMWQEAHRGARFGVLCEMLATFDDPASAPVRAAGYLQAWLAGEMLSAAALVPRKKKVRS